MSSIGDKKVALNLSDGTSVNLNKPKILPESVTSIFDISEPGIYLGGTRSFTYDEDTDTITWDDVETMNTELGTVYFALEDYPYYKYDTNSYYGMSYRSTNLVMIIVLVDETGYAYPATEENEYGYRRYYLIDCNNGRNFYTSAVMHNGKMSYDWKNMILNTSDLIKAIAPDENYSSVEYALEHVINDTVKPEISDYYTDIIEITTPGVYTGKVKITGASDNPDYPMVTTSGMVNFPKEIKSDGTGTDNTIHTANNGWYMEYDLIVLSPDEYILITKSSKAWIKDLSGSLNFYSRVFFGNKSSNTKITWSTSGMNAKLDKADFEETKSAAERVTGVNIIKVGDDLNNYWRTGVYQIESHSKGDILNAPETVITTLDDGHNIGTLIVTHSIDYGTSNDDTIYPSWVLVKQSVVGPTYTGVDNFEGTTVERIIAVHILADGSTIDTSIEYSPRINVDWYPTVACNLTDKFSTKSPRTALSAKQGKILKDLVDAKFPLYTKVKFGDTINGITIKSLNDIIFPGVYECVGGTSWPTSANFPVDSMYGFTLVVYRGNESSITDVTDDGDTTTYYHDVVQLYITSYNGSDSTVTSGIHVRQLAVQFNDVDYSGNPTLVSGAWSGELATKVDLTRATVAINQKQNKPTISTTDLTAGTSSLTTGELYIVYS